jgi:cell division protein FtsW
MKAKFPRVPVDTWLLILVLALVGLGSVIVFSASFARGEVKYDDPFFYFSAHMRNLAVGLAIMLILSQIPYQLWLKISPAIGAAVVVLLLAALHPSFARKTLGSARWLKHIPFQPSEAAKLAVVILLASYFARVGDLKSRFWYGFAVPCLLIVLYGGLIVLERDLGGALVVMGVVVCLMIAAGVRLPHMCCFAVFGPAVWLLITYYKHRVSRLLGWDDPWLYPSGEGYSVIHSFYAFANGGLTGASIGQSQEKMFFLPMAHTDYIFSILGEELGFIGVVATCLMFLLLAARGFSIALSTKGGGYHLAVGAVLVVLLPAIINMMVALSIIPAKGLPLPFFSYGGSSLVVSLAAMGVLLNISGQALKPAEAPMVVTPYAG